MRPLLLLVSVAVAAAPQVRVRKIEFNSPQVKLELDGPLPCSTPELSVDSAFRRDTSLIEVGDRFVVFATTDWLFDHREHTFQICACGVWTSAANATTPPICVLHMPERQRTIRERLTSAVDGAWGAFVRLFL